MNKREFEKYLKYQIKGLPLHKKEEELLKLEKEWIPTLRKKLVLGYIKCRQCGGYSKETEYKLSTQDETRHECTYSDAGYGDGDRYGEVLYTVKYRECPICHNKSEVDRWHRKVLWDKGRYE